MAIVTYADYAVNDYLYLCVKLPTYPNYAELATHCQQVVEKLLKGVLEFSFPDDPEIEDLITTSHNIQLLCDKAVKEYPSLAPLQPIARILTKYYIGPRYPWKCINNCNTRCADKINQGY